MSGDEFYTWNSTPQIVADVQAWLDAPGTHFGWMVRGNESTNKTTKRFDTREIPGSFKPRLIVYSTGP